MNAGPRWNARQHGLLKAMGLDLGGGADQPGVAVQIGAKSMSARSAEPAPTVAAVPARTEHERQATLATQASVANEATAALQQLDLDGLHEAVRACRACSLCGHRKQAVPGMGHPQAHWMIVGEGPGEQEDLQGEPFVGPSGRLLDTMLAAVGRSRQPAPAAQQVFIANSVKCRPPGNRNPSPDELAACAPFLQRQLALVKPRVVLALGRFAAQSLLGGEVPIGRLRGSVHRLADGTPVVVSYHPAYLLRQPQEKARAWEDLCLAADVADAAQARP